MQSAFSVSSVDRSADHLLKLSKDIPRLSEDEVDDILYFARTKCLSDLTDLLLDLSKTHNASLDRILLAAVDADSGNGPLHMACANGHTDIIHYLISLIPPSPSCLSIIDLSNGSGNTSLHWAALNGHLEAVKLLVAAGVDTLKLNLAEHDAMTEAERSGNLEVAEWLLSQRHGHQETEGLEEAQVDGLSGNEPNDEKSEESVHAINRLEDQVSSLDVNGNT